MFSYIIFAPPLHTCLPLVVFFASHLRRVCTAIEKSALSISNVVWVSLRAAESVILRLSLRLKKNHFVALSTYSMIAKTVE